MVDERLRLINEKDKKKRQRKKIQGREDMNNEDRAGRPSTSTRDENFDKAKKIVLANRRISIREVAEELKVKNYIVMLPQPPYSPHLALCDSFFQN
ncbi:unnamed protein product [Euphydryas editha]|uniref:Transposase n=1 Tax=Euphydryas editha TaxID=104508 RepID=A0AAU9U630_EUPED|nr:unnamed protein product [Euphydryas editha]